MKKQEKFYINIKFMQALHANNLKHICQELKKIKRCQLVEGKIEKRLQLMVRVGN